MWNFGSGKTFWTFWDMYDAPKQTTYIIANVPYSIVDHYYSTVDDLLNVFEVLEEYSIISNSDLENFYDARDYMKDILLIVDEAHLYLGARESLTKQSILWKLKVIFTQCRKRKIRIVFITQRLTQIDIYVRRLSDYVEEYNMRNFLGFEIDKKTVYLNKWDVVDIETDQSVKITSSWEAQTIKEETKIYSEYFRPLTSFLELLCMFKKSYRDIIKEEYCTYHICGYKDERVKPLTIAKLLHWLKVQLTDEQKKKQEAYLKKKQEDKNKTRFQKYLPTFSVFTWKIKQTIKSLFSPWMDINFKALYDEAITDEERQEKLEKVEKQIQQEKIQQEKKEEKKEEIKQQPIQPIQPIQSQKKVLVLD